ncbi:MAG: carboxymuconolactone decarboxylase family protein [Candidatus Bathyarchaeia archaeon]
MGEMEELISEYKKTSALLAQNNPEAAEAFSALSKAVTKDGALSRKVKELIALGIAIAVRCEYCIAIHAQLAINAGATREEMLEAAEVAVLMGGGPARTYVTELRKALEEFQKQG